MEFTDYGAVPAAMRLNNTMIGETMVQVSNVLNLALDVGTLDCKKDKISNFVSFS